MKEYANELFSMFFVLVIVLVLAWFILRVIKRAQYGNSSSNTLSFVKTLPVGNKERVVLIQYQGKEYMLGVTTGGINLLEKRIIEADEMADNVKKE